MKRNLLRGFCTILTLTGILLSNASFGQATLKHSYTFEEGTYEDATIYDQTGSLDGTMTGSAISIVDGKCVVSGATTNTDGYVVFDGVALDLASYNAISLEAFVETGEVLNTTYTMLAYFGSTTSGSNCFWIQPTRGATETRIEANNGSTTISAILSGYEVDDGEMHHLVAILSSEALTYYLDGVVIAEASTEGADYISTLGTDIAQLFKGPDGWPDPNYNCWLEEFNIYDGVLEQQTIAQRAGNYLGLDLTNASLEDLNISVGTMEPAFDPETDIYEINVPYGTTSLTITTDPVVNGVTVTMLDGLGNELEDGVLSFDKDDGIDVEVIVTALDGVAEQSFFLSVFPEDGESSATLESIDLSTGSLIGDFMMDSTRYTAIVPPGTTSVDVTGVPNWDMATVEGDGTVTLADGMGSTTITVTSEDGTSTMEYTVEVYVSNFQSGTEYYLVHEFSDLVAAESGEAFNQVVLADAAYQDSSQIWQFVESGVEDQYYIQNKEGNYICLSRTSANDYDLEVYPDLPEVSLDSARFIVNEFEPGRFRIISVSRQQVSATDNMMGTNNGLLGSAFFSDKWRSATNDPLTVINLKFPEEVVSEYDLHLADITINGASIKPAFNPAYKIYYATIPPGVTSVEVTATPRDTITPPTITGTGTVDVSDEEGTITITVTAAADPQYTREYVIHYISDTELTLTHSYTFDEGTAQDQVGGAHGTVNGGTFADSAFISETEGDYIILPAEEIALNTYPSFTMEAHVTTGTNPAWTMFTYFGNATGGDHSFFISLAGDNNQARAVLDLGDGEAQAASTEPGPGEVHHYVSVVTNDTVYWYVDGTLAQKTATPAGYLLRDIAGTHAWMGFGAYNDPTWMGTTHEFNIYSGQMDAATVAARAQQYFGGISIDATLASLTVDVGDLLPAFDPDIMNYSVVIPEGTTTVNVSAVPNDEKSTVEGTGDVDVSSGSGSASVVVTAENGATKTYNIGFSTPEEFSLMHSYTFDDGTATDVVGDADGTPFGGTIANGAYTSATDSDYVELPAEVIAINNYSAITLEGYIFADVDNTGATMLAYFGGNETGVGGNGYFLTPDRWTESRTAISCGNITEPWNAEQGVTGDPVSVGYKHHVVSVLADSTIAWYI
ncbi:MAG: cadherin-like beta sandwich domain-containing protein, partial [Spirochaetales bacterium]|nr:cadherin-like beta sandwich domain-containing protein [Spirochaetales bacterium]